MTDESMTLRGGDMYHGSSMAQRVIFGRAFCRLSNIIEMLLYNIIEFKHMDNIIQHESCVVSMFFW